MRTLTITKVKRHFHRYGVQLSAEMIKILDDHFAREIDKMAKRCKEGNIKRLTPDIFWVALGHLGSAAQAERDARGK